MKRAIVIGVLVVSLLVAGAGPAIAQQATSPGNSGGVSYTECTDDSTSSIVGADDYQPPPGGGGSGDDGGGNC